MSRKVQKPIRSGYAIFREYLFQGRIPACYDETDYPVIFETELEAQREITDNLHTRIQEFLAEEREFNDAITTEEFVLPAVVWPDGSISIEDGRLFGKID